MFVDTLNAPPDAIGGTVLRVAEQLGASLIVTTTDCYVRPCGLLSASMRLVCSPCHSMLLRRQTRGGTGGY